MKKSVFFVTGTTKPACIFTQSQNLICKLHSDTTAGIFFIFFFHLWTPYLYLSQACTSTKIDMDQPVNSGQIEKNHNSRLTAKFLVMCKAVSIW